MSYELSFSPGFFLAEGEPYDAAVGDGCPCTVWQAIVQMKRDEPDEWDEMAQAVFGVEGAHLDEESVLLKIQETNMCTDLASPVDVWIDEEGDYTVTVYEEEDR